MNIKVSELKSHHIPDIYNILKEYPDYFDDSIKMSSVKHLKRMFNKHVRDGLTVFKNDEIIGCFWIDNVKNDFGEMNILLKRKRIHPQITPSLVRTAYRYFFLNCNLKMIFGLIKVTNHGALKLTKKSGAIITKTLKDYITIKGKKIDCVFASILREAIL